MAIWRLRVISWIPKATNTHSEYVILIFPQHQLLHKRASVLRYMHIAYPVPLMRAVALTPFSGQLEPQFGCCPLVGAPLSDKNTIMEFSSIWLLWSACTTLPTDSSSFETIAETNSNRIIRYFGVLAYLGNRLPKFYFLGSRTLKDGTDILSRNVSN